jgi:hypothetical protein
VASVLTVADDRLPVAGDAVRMSVYEREGSGFAETIVDATGGRR